MVLSDRSIRERLATGITPSICSATTASSRRRSIGASGEFTSGSTEDNLALLASVVAPPRTTSTLLAWKPS